MAWSSTWVRKCPPSTSPGLEARCCGEDAFAGPLSRTRARSVEGRRCVMRPDWLLAMLLLSLATLDFVLDVTAWTEGLAPYVDALL